MQASLLWMFALMLLRRPNLGWNFVVPRSPGLQHVGKTQPMRCAKCHQVEMHNSNRVDISVTSGFRDAGEKEPQDFDL